MFKKYIYKNGVRHGPYLYENTRVGDKVITRYVGVAEHSIFSSKKLWIIGLSILILSAIAFFVYQGNNISSNVVFDTKLDYVSGEPIQGTINFNLMEGELVPADSKILIDYGGQIKEFTLSELVSASMVSGSYYVENANIAGSGDGYGVQGTKDDNDVVSFDILVKSYSSDSSDSSEGSSEIPAEGDSGNENNGGGNDETGGNGNSGDNNNENDGTNNGNENNGGGNDNGNNGAGNDASSGESTGDSGSGESSGEESVSMTGEAVVENEFVISGSVKQGEEFEYTLEEGQSAEIVSGSVRGNGEVIGDGEVNLEVSGNSLKVSSDYSEGKSGFGKNYVGGTGMTLEIDVSKFGLVAVVGEKIKISLVYSGQEIVSAEQTLNVISVEPVVPVEQVPILQNESVVPVVPVVPIVEENLTIVSGNLKISTSRLTGQIKVGEKVSWKKNVRVENASERLVVELPKEAENVSIEKIVGSEAVEAVESMNLIKNSVSTLSEVAGPLKVTLVDSAPEYDISYDTPAPQSFEKITSSGKEVVISGPDDAVYTDVLSFANINEVYSVGEEGNIKIYWKEGASYVSFNASDLNGNGKLDYVEWVTPHLSNQTFEIILISKAEHLDENRTIIESVYDFVKKKDGVFVEIPAEHYIRATFEKELSNGKDITIYARSSSPDASVQVYLVDGSTAIADFGIISSDGQYIIILDGLLDKQSSFDLKVSGGAIEFDYIVDPTGDASVPQTMSVQGKLTNSSGSALSGTYSMNFSLYTAATGGTAFYSNLQSVTTDSSGVFHAILPSVNYNFASQYYLGLKVGTDAEMTPRINITSNAYAFRANYANELDSTNNYNIQNLSLADKITFTLGQIIDGTSSGILKITANLFNVSGKGEFLGNVTAPYFVGSGAYLTGISSSTYNASYAIWAYNQTTDTYNLYNSAWSSTYNETYAGTTSAWNGNSSALLGTINNASYLSTYNATYAAGINTTFNQTLTNSLYSSIIWGYNMTQPFTDWLATFVYNYNQTAPANTYTDTQISSINYSTKSVNSSNFWDNLDAPLDSWTSTYNATYAGLINNASYLDSYNATYAGLVNNASYLDRSNSSYARIDASNLFGDFNQSFNATTLFINSVLGRVGIGTINPTHTLNVVGDINFTGALIGTVPSYNATYAGLINNASYLDTYNATYAGLVNNASYLDTYNASYETTRSEWAGNKSDLLGIVNNGSYLGTYNASYDVKVSSQWVNATNANISYSNGNVGIGTTNPSAKLTIDEVNTNTNVGANLITNLEIQNSNNATNTYSRLTFNDATEELAAITVKKQASKKGDIYFQTRNNNATGLVTRMMIQDGTGYVAIGHASPEWELDIRRSSSADVGTYILNSANTGGSDVFSSLIVGGTSAGDPMILMGVTSGSYWTMGVDNSDGDKFVIAQNIDLGSANADKFVINTSGSVGIGTVNPTHTLNVVGDINFTGALIGTVPSYNETYAGLVNNASYLDTYNATYAGLINNASYLDTYNATYATFARDIYVNESGDTMNGSLLIKGDALGIFDVQNSSGASKLFVNTTAGSGFVGIGTNTPTNLLDVKKNIDSGVLGTITNGVNGPAAYAVWRALNYAGNYVQIGILSPTHTGYGTSFLPGEASVSASVNLTVMADGNGSVIKFATGAAPAPERMRLDALGRLGIGTTTPSHNLTVVGDINFTGTLIGVVPSYNATYAGLINNASYLDTYNATYETTRSEWAGNKSDLLGIVNNGSYLGAYNASYARIDATNAFGDFNQSFNATTLFINSNLGRVGIGTNTPASILNVYDGQINPLRVSSSVAGAGIQFVDSTTANVVSVGALGNNLTMYAGGSVRATIGSNGNFGIGTVNPVNLLHLNSAGTLSNTRIQITDASTGTATTDGFQIGLNASEGYVGTQDATPILFATNKAERMRITETGNVNISGYTNLGADAPRIKVKYINGTTAAAEGGIVSFTHGLTASKIISINSMVEWQTDSFITHVDPSNGYNYRWFTNDASAPGNISFQNHATQSESILSKPIKVTILYTD